jgi:hypothetical protein
VAEPAIHRRFRPLTVLVLAGLCLLPGGCVRRRLTVRTTPPGAQVFVDDQEIGTTPCSASFVYYGTRKITLIKDGYRTETLYQKLATPWYELPPLDFINENLSPHEIRDERLVDVQLVPQEIVPYAKLLERAQTLRDGALTGNITPAMTLPGAADPKPQISLPGEGLPGGAPIPRYPLPAPDSGQSFGSGEIVPLPPIEAVPAPAQPPITRPFQ